MQAPAIVPALQELKDVGSGFIARQVIALLDELTLQRCIEALHWRVVPAITLAAHGAEDAVLLQPLAVLMRCELPGFKRSSQHQPALPLATRQIPRQVFAIQASFAAC